MSARLIIICGLPATGKTTLAKKLETELSGIRMSPDDWMAALDINLWDSSIRDKLETLQWEFSKKLLQRGNIVIIEWGTWGRSERDTLRIEARELDAKVELHYLSAPIDVLMKRLDERGAEDPPIKREDMERWVAGIEVPSPKEMALFDAPLIPSS